MACISSNSIKPPYINICINHRRRFSLKILAWSTTSNIKTLISINIFELKIAQNTPLKAENNLSEVCILLAKIPIFRVNQVDNL